MLIWNIGLLTSIHLTVFFFTAFAHCCISRRIPTTCWSVEQCETIDGSFRQTKHGRAHKQMLHSASVLSKTPQGTLKWQEIFLNVLKP